MDANRFGNWIADENRFNLEQPPEWWLQALFDFDHMLVVMPSRLNRRYLLGRRRQYSVGLGDVAMLDNKHPDTNMCFANGVLPISPLNFSGQWTLHFLDQLKARDTWAVTGGPTALMGNEAEAKLDALVDSIEAQEQRVEQQERQNTRDTFYHMGRDAYRSLKARIGSRNKRASDYHGAARPVGGGSTNSL